MTKSPSSTPLEEIFKNEFDEYGTLSLLNSSLEPSLLTYARNRAKSPVCRGYIQLSISPPYSPICAGGA